MKFEEVLPKMRDEGRIAIHNGNQYKLFDGNLMFRTNNEWVYVTFTSKAYITNDWSIESRKVKKWRWAFGFGYECLPGKCNMMTEEQAEKYRVEKGFAWMERINHTMIEVEE